MGQRVSLTYDNSRLRHFKEARFGAEGCFGHGQEIGIASARVPSSSSNEADANRLEQQLHKDHPYVPPKAQSSERELKSYDAALRLRTLMAPTFSH